MKIRSLLLFACMIVVPMIAMFSHKIPPDFRVAARRHLWEPAQRALTGGGTAPEPVAMPPVAAGQTLASAAPTESIPEQRPASQASEHAVASPPASLREIEGRLAALGGFAVECVPVTPDGGMHRCSCRVAADPSGQLQRVFQSSASDPTAAMHELLQQVEVWKARLASIPPSAPSQRFQ